MADIIFQDKWEFSEILDGDNKDYKVVDGDDDWTQDGGRYQTKSTVVQHVPTGRYYQGHESRSGSPFTEWEYNTDPILYEVEKHTETRVVVTWKAVPQAEGVFMNRDLIYAYLALRLSQKRGIRQEMGFGERHANETDTEFDKRFLTFVHHEGKIRTLERLVDEYEKQY